MSASTSPLSLPTLVTALALLPAALYLYTRLSRTPSSPPPPPPADEADTQTKQTEKADDQPKSIMQPARTDLAPPKDDPFTQEELKAFDGTDTEKPIYVAIKGTIFDVTHKRDTYGKGGSYNLFAGKDASKALGKSSLKDEDASPDYSTLEAAERKVLDDWYAFFEKRYNIVGRVTDLPAVVASL